MADEETESHHDNEGCETHEAGGAACPCVQCMFGPQAMNALIEQGIERVGFVVIPIEDGDPPFCYTVGLTETFNHPEFIMQGKFNPNQMAEIIGGAVDKLREDEDAFNHEEVPDVIKVKVHGELQDGFIGCRDVTAENKIALLCRAVARYGEDGFQAKQLIFPDQHALLPWQEGFNQDWGQAQKVLYASVTKI